MFLLRRLNAHLSSIVSSKPFQTPVEVVPRMVASSGSRLSSFGFSGTIAHGAFEARKPVTSPTDSKSLYRNRRFIARNETTRLDWLLEAPGPQQPRLDEAIVFSGALSSAAEALFSHHVVGGAIILPGVGYVEMALAASSSRALAAVAFLRPCSLSGPSRGEKCVLRCTRRAETLEIASARGTESSSFATCFAGTLANIDIDHTETASGRELSARRERFIEAPSRGRSSVVLQATFGPRPRLLEVSSRIGGTDWTFSARNPLCCSSRQLRRIANLAHAVSDKSKCTILHLAGREPCNSLHGTILLSRSLCAASPARNTTQIHSREADGLKKKQVLTSACFQELPIATANLSKPWLARKNKPRTTEPHRKPTKTRCTRSRDALLKELTDIASEVIGTSVAADAVLMETGLDSISATELLQQMSQRLDMELPQTLLFDHPTLESVVDSLSLDHALGVEIEEEYRPDEYSSDDEAATSLWDLYSALKLETKPESFLAPATKSARRAVVLLAFSGSGSKHILSTLSAHQHLCVCEDLCLVPFKTVLERNEVLSSRRDNVQDGLDDAVKTLRNCKMPDTCHLFGTVASTYRALQEWCAPRILVDGTEVYSAVPE